MSEPEFPERQTTTRFAAAGTSCLRCAEPANFQIALVGNEDVTADVCWDHHTSVLAYLLVNGHVAGELSDAG
ncbi:hypothetical protein ABZ543_13250 [Streptomyces roseifaciens]